jgi:hypothetical protein
MKLFLLVYLALYGAMHAYLVWRARQAFGLGAKGTTFLVLWAALMVAAPIVVRLGEMAGWVAFPRVLAWVAWSWLGLLFLYLCVSWALDLARPLAWALGHLHIPAARWVPSGRGAFLFACILSVAGSVWGYADAWNIRTRHVEIRSPKVPKEVGRFRVVLVSDIHLGLMLGKYRLATMLERVREADPDLLICAGDLVDGDMTGLEGVSEHFAAIHAPSGHFAVTGNHEFYAGLEQSLQFMSRAGFTVLRSESADVGAWLTVAGVDDPAGAQVKQESRTDEAALLDGADRRRFLLLLKHQPKVAKESAGKFDLQLSGHVHGGQVFPFHLAVWMAYALRPGLHQIQEGGAVYVSRGTGTWGPPMRLFAPAEVTVIDLVSE